jgi:hypothetical protein
MTGLALSRREAIARIIAATALASSFNLRGFSAQLDAPGIGFDPNLLKKEIPWPRLLSDAEKRVVTALADVMIPEDEFGPAASGVGVPDFIDEWVSAPYEQQLKDRKVICDGIAWIEAEAGRRFGHGFANATPVERNALVEETFSEGTAAWKQGHNFAILFRDRVAGGYYTTPEGWKALGYTGNAPMAEFPGPSNEALRHAGLL